VKSKTVNTQPWPTKSDDIELAISMMDSYFEVHGDIPWVLDVQTDEETERFSYSLPSWIRYLADELESMHGDEGAFIFDRVIGFLLEKYQDLGLSDEEAKLYRLLVRTCLEDKTAVCH